MTTIKNPESEMLSQLATLRQNLVDERDNLLARAAEIDAALSATPAPAAGKAPQKPVKGPTNIRTPKTPGIRDAVLLVLAGSPASTIKQIQELIPEHSPKSVESVVHSLASAGTLTKDSSSPKKFSLAAQPEPKKSNGSAARPQAQV